MSAPELEYYFRRYGDLDLQRRMVSDRPRTDAFAKALFEEVTAADVVLDVGTGTGILAMLAAKAGARRVYAVDRARVVHQAEALVGDNGLEETVIVIEGAAESLELAEPVDLLVSEWLGNLAFVESMLDDVLVARDRLLAPRGRMMPSAVELVFAPLDDAIGYHGHGPGFWRNPVSGLDLSRLEGVELAEGRALQTYLDPGAFLAPPGTLARFDLRTAAAAELPRGGRLTFVTGRDGVWNGLAGWFVAELSPSVRLDTGPHAPATHWAQTYFPIEPIPLVAGTRVELDVELLRDPDEPRRLRVRVRGLGRDRTYVVE